MEQMDTMDVPCFENLPVEMQQLIFSYCGTRTRREITLVCKGWAEKLEYFREDFRVYLHHCYLREALEPVSLLMKSTRRCHSLCLGGDIRGLSDNDKEVQTRFFSYLGREVQDLHISTADVMFLKDPDFLLFFPKLKKLTVSGSFSFRSFPETLEHVHVVNWFWVSGMDVEDLEHLRCIKSLKLLTLGTIRLNFCSTDVHTWDENLIVFLQYNTFWQRLFFKSNNNFLNAPIVTFDDVTYLSVCGPLSTSFSFNKFPNLRSIRVAYYYGCTKGPCLNFHESVLCEGVAELEITEIQDCIECFKSIINSFPNVKKISFERYCLTNQHIKYICFKLPNLIHLKADSVNLIYEIIYDDQPEYSIGNLKQLESLSLKHFNVSNVLLHWPLMPHLKKVQFETLPDDHVLNNFTEKTPNLESFEIVNRSHLLSDMAIEIIAKNWPNLRTLRLKSNKPCDVSPIKRFCRNLRTLEFGSVHTFTSFFDEIPTLKEMTLKGTTKYRHLKERNGWD